MASRAVNLVDHLGGWLFRSNWHLLWILPSAQGISHAANTSFEVRVKNHKNLEAIRVTTRLTLIKTIKKLFEVCIKVIASFMMRTWIFT